MNIPASFPPLPFLGQPTSARPAAAPRTTPEPASAPVSAAPSAEPAGEASLLDVLSPEERAFFDQQAALGPLTYGRPRTPATSLAPTGQRLDVRG